MAHNFRRQVENTSGQPTFYVAKSGTSTGLATTPETAMAHPQQSAALNGAGFGSLAETDQPACHIDGQAWVFVGAGHYQGPNPNGQPKNLIADGKVVWYVNGALNFGTKSDGGTGLVVDGFIFRFVTRYRGGSSQGGFIGVLPRLVKRCFFDFVSRADINSPLWGGYLNQESAGNFQTLVHICTDTILRRFNGPRSSFERCILLDSVATSVSKFRNSYADATSSIELRDVAGQPALSCVSLTNFGNNNIRGLIRVKGDTFGFTDIETFKANYGLTSRTDLTNVDPQFNRAASDDYTLKIQSRHLDLAIGPAALRYALMYYVTTTASPGDPCTIGNTKLENTADNSLIPFRQLDGFTVNASGGLVIIPNSAGVFEASYTTARMPVQATSQRIKRLPVISGLNFDTDYPANGVFSSVAPEVFNNNVPDYSNSSTNGGKTPNRLTIQARFSNLPNPDENDPSHWSPNTGGYYDFEIDEEPLFDSVTGLGSGNPAFVPGSVNVRPVLARWIQIRYKSRNDYYSI